MRLTKGFIAVSILLGVVYSCSPLKKIDASKSAAMASYAEQNYPQAYEQLGALIQSYQSANVQVPNDIFIKTADCAVALKKYDAAADYFSQSLKDSVTMTGVKGYIASVKEVGDMDVLDSALDTYASFLNEQGQGNYLNEELFALALYKNDQDAILKVFPDLNKPGETESMAYLTALEKAGKKKEAVDFCNDLIKENPEYYQAKEWKAVYYYNIAEEGYKREMAKYNKNKNYTAYVYLKRDLKKVSANYRVAKNLFEDIRKQYPSEKKYIKYLKNIYIRLEMKREASAMDKLLQ